MNIIDSPISPAIMRKMHTIEDRLSKTKPSYKLTTEDKKIVYHLRITHGFQIKTIIEYLLKERKKTISRQSLWRIIKTMEKNIEKEQPQRTPSPHKNNKYTILLDENVKKEQKKGVTASPQKKPKKTETNSKEVVIPEDIEIPKKEEKEPFFIKEYTLSQEDLELAENDFKTALGLPGAKKIRLGYLVDISEKVDSNSNLKEATYHWNDLRNKVDDMINKIRRED